MGIGMEDGEARLDYALSQDAGHIVGLKIYINLYSEESKYSCSIEPVVFTYAVILLFSIQMCILFKSWWRNASFAPRCIRHLFRIHVQSNSLKVILQFAI